MSYPRRLSVDEVQLWCKEMCLSGVAHNIVWDVVVDRPAANMWIRKFCKEDADDGLVPAMLVELEDRCLVYVRTEDDLELLGHAAKSEYVRHQICGYKAMHALEGALSGYDDFEKWCSEVLDSHE